MNSKDIKPWRERLAIIPVVPTVSRSVARFKCIFDEISDLRQALEAVEAREIKFASEVNAKVCAIEGALGIEEKP